MSETLQNHLWQIAEWIIAPIIVSFVISYFQGKKKILGWEVLSKWAMFNNNNRKNGNLEMTQNGRPIKDVSFVAIRISNEGNVDILPGDYNGPMTLAVNEDARILSAYISDKNPEGLPIEISCNGATAHLGKVPMNAGDSLTINMYVSGLNRYPRPITHIAGLKDIRELPRKHERQFREAIVIGIFIFLMARTLPPHTLEATILHINFPYPLLALLILLVAYSFREKLRKIVNR